MPSPNGLPAPANAAAVLLHLPLSQLIPAPANARQHSPEQVKQIAESIRTFGPVKPILVDEGNEILAGHGARLGALEAGLLEFPCVRLSHLTADQKRAYRIADNKLALNSEWDLTLLAVELDGLRVDGFDLNTIGFTDAELRDLSIGVDGGDMPTVPEGDRTPFRQMTFVVHDEQFEEVTSAVTLARTRPEADTGLNDNVPGNAITLICREWLAQRNNSGHE